MDIKHVLSRNPLQAVNAGRPSPRAAPDQLGWLDLEGGLVEIGHQGDAFGFDNEQPRYGVWLKPYRLADRLVTNGEWLVFMSDKGYRRHEPWLSGGWAKVNVESWRAPFDSHGTVALTGRPGSVRVAGGSAIAVRGRPCRLLRRSRSSGSRLR